MKNDSIVVAGLSRAEKEKLIQQLLQQRSEKRDTMVSYGQKALWLLQHVNPDNCAYHIQAAWDILSPVDERKLQATFQSLSDTYSSLRTTFMMENGDIKRIVKPDCEVDFRVHRLDEWGPEAEAMFARHLKMPFSLNEGPLFRVNLYCAPKRPPRLLLSLHHIITDAWSIVILLRDFMDRYQQEISEGHPYIEERSYSAFVEWQDRYLKSARAEHDWLYWKKTLAGPLPVCSLIADNPGAMIEGNRGSSCTFRFSESLSQEIIQLSRKLGITLNSLLLASFAALLYRYTEQEDLVIGTFASGRSEAGLEHIFGYLVNTVAIRLECSGDLSFQQLSDEVKRKVLESMEHQDYPFPLVVERLQPERDARVSPIFQVAFVMERAQSSEGRRSPLFISNDQDRVELGSMILQPVPLETADTQFELVLMMEETETFIHGSFMYRSKLFSDSFMATMARLFTDLLEHIVRNPQERIGNLRFYQNPYGQKGQHVLPTAAEPHICLHHLLEYQGEYRPEAAAITFLHETVSYRQLDQRANQIARLLARRGVKKGDFAGVCLERSPDMIAAVFAVLKLGAVFIPIDPAYPPQRKAYMVELVNMAAIISASTVDPHSFGDGVELVLLDLNEEEIACQSVQPVKENIGIHDLAYVIFTSGSTGKPKAVLVEHRGIWNMAEAQRRYFDLNDTSKILQFASFSFDAWIFEIVMAFRSGGTLCMAAAETLLPGKPMVRWMKEQRISHAVLPPSVLSLIPDVNLPDLQVVISAGEACTREIVARWAPGRRFFNAYGPSEATVWVSVKECFAQESVIDLGEAIPNVEIHVFNEYLQHPLPGAIGELHVGGVGLARGYYNNAEMTEAKFIAYSDAEQPQAKRLYKTGDLVRCLPDGSLQFIGRKDDQVKIRGVRIHLGEIEHHLSEHAGIAGNAVLVTGVLPEHAALAAFIVLQPHVLWDETGVRSFLKERMPGHYIPSRFIVIGDMPLTPNGKVDRKALQASLEHHAHDAVEERSYSNNFVEEILMEMWKRLLAKKQVRVDDQFFEAGGHSLLATQLISNIHDVFSIELPIHTVFAKPVLREMAHEIRLLQEDAGTGAAQQEIVPLNRTGDYRVPLTSAQQRMWFLQKLDEAQTAYLIPGVLSLEGPLDMDALQLSLQEIIRRHDSLRATIHLENGSPVAAIRADVTFQLEVKDCTEEDAWQWMHAECCRPIYFSNDLYRITLLHTGDNRHYLVMVLHHIMTDGWSMGIIMNELRQLYAGQVEKKRVELPYPPLAYSDYALWEQSWLDSDSYQQQLRYWTGMLRKPIPPLTLPSDYPRSPVQSYRGKRICLQLPQALSEPLMALGQRHNCTLFMTLIAIFNLLLYRLSGASDIAVGVPIAGRNQQNLDKVVGLFVNTLLLRTDLSGEPDFTRLLMQIRETAIGAYAHQDMPFEKLVETLRPDRDLSRSSMFQVMFNMLNIPPVTAEFSGLTAQIVDMDEHDSKCDITLYAQENADGIHLEMVYAADLFREERAAEMLAQFQCLCHQVVENPERSIEQYSLLTENSNALLPDPALRLKHADDHLLKPIHVLFANMAERCPEAAAVIDRDEAVYTYRDLDRLSDELASNLIQHTHEKRGVIAVCGERSVSLIVALLAVLKSGSVFIVLDPAHPSGRLAEMIKVSSANGIVFLDTGNAQPTSLYDDLTNLVSFTMHYDGTAGCTNTDDSSSEKLAQIGISLHDTAYILFTSGTTAVPKGIPCTHEPLSNFIRWYVNEFRLDSQDRFSMFSGLGHDPLLRDIFVPLSIGAAVCIPDGSKLVIPSYINQWMARHKITVSHLTPAMGMVIAGWSGHERNGRVLGDWRYALFGGDVLVPSHIENMRAIAPRIRCFNCYGATETPQIMGIYAIPEPLGPFIPIGKGREGAQLLVMDSELRQKGIGETGEICIRSPYLASGYLTAADADGNPSSFAQNPYTSAEDDYIYRTSDLGRYMPDGNVEFIARQGDLVKVRGYRIQLREIQQVILQHPSVTDCFMLCQVHQDNRIIAYVVPAQQPFHPSGLQMHLREKLPDYMLPAVYMELAQIPLTRNGKIDVERLPEPDAFNYREEQQATAMPETALQQKLAEVWQHHLNVKEVGIHDNFFEAGGHSLLLIRVQQHLEEALQRQIHVVDLFKYPTIYLLARYLEGSGEAEEERHTTAHRKSKQRAAQQAQKSRRKGERK
ncbi:amino acid adenylation domain-containing protein [Paenibacillus sp. MER TA 81-3]|nr:amino acid adenylation domain-containing protein [Paenibacillus sp. MER TA 81-3]